MSKELEPGKKAESQKKKLLPLSCKITDLKDLASWRMMLPGIRFSFSWLSSKNLLMLGIYAILAGILSGLGAVFFRWLIRTFKELFFNKCALLLEFMGNYYVILIPAIGGLIIGPIMYFLARETKGAGIPEVMLSVTTRGGKIRHRVAFIKALVSSICIGSGGSAGREGPIIQIGASLGSSIAQLLKMPEDDIRLLLACGAAGGIAATFNTPIAGVFFAMEVILGGFPLNAFSYVALTSVTASIISRAMLGNEPAFSVPHYAIISSWEFIFYAILGILSAFAARAFIKALYSTENIFNKISLPEYLKPALGGLLVGVIGLHFPHIFGVGYETIESALYTNLDFQLLVILFVLKILATSFTIGSGGSGGFIAPSLYLGAMLGGGFGKLIHYLYPDITTTSGAYAIVGMAAVFAGMAHAPVTAIIMLYEMTGNYYIILPLMTAVVISVLISHLISEENIYTIKLLRRGIDLHKLESQNPLDNVTVGQVMTRDFRVIHPDMGMDELINLFNKTGHHGFPVIDRSGTLTGMVTLRDVEYAYLRHKGPPGEDPASKLKVKDIATHSLMVAYPDQTVNQALHLMGTLRVGRIPVVDRKNKNRLVGILRRADLLEAYSQAMSLQKVDDSAIQLKRGDMGGMTLLEIELAEDSPVSDKAIRELKFPRNSIIAMIRRKGCSIFPHGDTILYPHDHVIIVCEPGCREEVRSLLTGKTVEESGKKS
ncbi:MAG: chloride channel protein [Candidatus Eremiobacteraeota bacterium]|nr:chloride channel protein [Candidatus Eremiobacteraeota bacterium]